MGLAPCRFFALLASFAVSPCRDDHVLLAGIQVEGAQVVVYRGGDEDESATGGIFICSFREISTSCNHSFELE